MSLYTARFIPQQTLSWLGGDCYPADPKGDTEWDVTEFFMSDAFTDDERSDMLESGYDETTDRLRDDPNAPEWVREWDGPFEVAIITVDG